MNKPVESLKISVVIPVKNASKTISSCLEAIYSNNNVDFEVIVVDDGSTDDTINIISKYKCLVLKNNLCSGVSGARNSGAFASNGDLLVFIDADIVVSKKILSKMLEKIRYTDVAAVVGMLTENIRFNNFSSQYKNLWMCYTFNNLPDSISLIFSSIAAIKKDIFLKCGGFDINYKSPNVEDNELGIKLSDAGYNIIFDKTLQVQHLKRYTLCSLLKTHYFRTKGLIKLFNRKKLIRLSKNNPSSIPNLFLFNIPLTIAIIYFLISLFLKNNFFPKIVITSFLILIIIFINYKWLYFLNKKKGIFFALKSLFYLPIESLVILFGLAVGQIEYFAGKRY